MANYISSIWTPEKWIIARKMRVEGYTYDAISERLGVTLSQVANRFANAKRDEIDGRPSRLSFAQIEEREARWAANEMRDQTATLCGDPPVGYSELDKRRARQA